MNIPAQRSYTFASAGEVPANLWPWKSFTPAELACNGSGRLVLVPEFLERLQGMRDAFGRPMVISSGYRSPAHNAAVSATGEDGPHTTGRAVDVRISGPDAYLLLKLALMFGFTGIGISQKGEHGARFLHLDDIPDPAMRPRVWSY